MRASLLLAALIATSLPMRAHSQPAGALSYHGSPERSGHFVVPMRRIPAGCCARTASGHAAVAPPTSLMNSRRLIAAPKGRDTPN